MSEEELRKAVEAQARRVQTNDTSALQQALESTEELEQEAMILKREQERVRLYSDESTD